MKRLQALLVLGVLLLTGYGAQAEIGLIVNKDIFPQIETAVLQYKSALEAGGETVHLNAADFNAGNTRAELRELRTYLRNRFNTSDLSGAVLIGELPRADYENFRTNADGDRCQDQRFPIDYYFMDLDKEIDTDWKDDDPKGESDVFDGYSGDKQMEIWISRVIAHNFRYVEDHDRDVSIGVPKDGSRQLEYGTEADILNDYFARLLARMTTEATVPRRAVNIGDYKNWFNPDSPGVQHLGVPFITLKYPHDTPSIWVREIQKGYEMAAVFEHSSPHVNAFALDQPENSTGSFHSYWAGSDRDRVFLRLPIEDGASTSLFFNSFGCSNMQYDEQNCLGQMYAILHSGLTSLGATTSNWGFNSHERFCQELADGQTFGESFRRYVNTLSWDYGTLTMTLLGAGTLSLAPAVANSLPALSVERVWAEKVDVDRWGRAVKGPFLHEDRLRLYAEVADEFGAPVDDTMATFTWHGLEDAVEGNGALFILEGHNLPGYSNGSTEGEYFITLHVDGPDYQSASAVLSFKGWRFRKFGDIYYTDPPHNNLPAHLNRHSRIGQTDAWQAHIRGLSGDIGGTSDDFVFYYSDFPRGEFEVTAEIDGWRNPTTADYDPEAKAGVMIRADDSVWNTGAVNAFIGVTHDNRVVFQYRPADSEDTIQNHVGSYLPGSSLLKLQRDGRKVYAWLSRYGSTGGFTKIGEMEIGPQARVYAGFAYACNDTTLWEWNSNDFSKERGVVFANMDATWSDPLPITPMLEYVNEVDGTYTVYFGYDNPNDYGVIVEDESRNYIVTGTERIPFPITEFAPGRVEGAFGYEMAHEELTWYLTGRQAVADKTDVQHYRITPSVARVVDNCDGTHTAHFDYHSDHPISVTKETGDLNRYEFSNDYYYDSPPTDFQGGFMADAAQVTFEGEYVEWHLEGIVARASSADATNVCPPMVLYRAFAFGADGFTRTVHNAPSARYEKIVQYGANFEYDSARGYGYTDLEGLDRSINNRGVLSGDDEIYDQFIGVKNVDSGDNQIVFRIDVPPGAYRFVAAGGDARYPDHKTSIAVSSGGVYSDGWKYLVKEKKLPRNTFWTVGFEDKRPPAGDGGGRQPNLLPMETAPYLRVYGGYDDGYGYDSGGSIDIHQMAPGGIKEHGGDLCLVEIWYRPEINSITNGEPKGYFGAGGQTDEVTEPETWRWAEWYYGHIGIDQVAWKKDRCGQNHCFAVGWHQDDLAEYLMKFGGDFSRLILRGRADRPGPVELAVFVDGEYKATVFWDNNSDCNQDTAVDIAGVDYGVHAVAVKFVNDYYRPPADRNFYLDGLYVARQVVIPSLTGGQPKDKFGAGGQSDTVTEPGEWREAAWFYGHEGIDEIAWKYDGCGNRRLYAVGWHQNDTAEYLMKIGGEYAHLILSGKADRPGPVEIEIYIDGEYQTTVTWDNDNDADQHLDVQLWGIPFGTHAVAVKFVNDYWNPGAGEDRNLYLEALRASKIGVTKIISGGEAWDAWKSINAFENGWETLGFDDSAWRDAYAPYPNPSRPDEIICGTTARFSWDYPDSGTPNGRNGPDEAWFRKTFYLYQVSEISKAEVVLGADDDFDFFVNGRKVFSDWDGTAWSAPFKVNILPHLVEGENVFAVYARDSYGIYEWLLFDAVIE